MRDYDNRSRPAIDRLNVLLAPQTEIEMNRSGGIGIVGVIIIVLVVLWLVGVIKI
jgi:hypothetical protein